MTQAEPLSVAVLGAGRWGSHLIRQFLLGDIAPPGDLPPAGLRHRTRLVAVADPNPALLAAAAERWGDRPQWAQVNQLTDGLAAIALPNVEAVVIATPATTHVALVTAALEAGKHVLVEKPLTIDPLDGDRLGALARSRDRVLMVDHTYLFHPAVERGKEICRAGHLGKIYQGYAARTHLGPVRQDVDALWDLAIHDLAIFNTWLGALPTAVAARGQSWLQPGLADLVWLDLRYPGDVPVTIQVAWHDPHKQRRLVLSGDRAALVFDELNLAEPLVLQGGEFVSGPTGPFTPSNLRREAIAVPAGEPLGKVCASFVAQVLSGQPEERSTAQVGANLTRILSAASRSLAGGGAWQSLEYSA